MNPLTTHADIRTMRAYRRAVSYLWRDRHTAELSRVTITWHTDTRFGPYCRHHEADDATL